MNYLYRVSFLTVLVAILPFFNSLIFAQDYDVTLPVQCNQVVGGNETLVFNGVPPNANGDATLTFSYNGDLNGTSTNPEFLTFIDENGSTIGLSNATSAQCGSIFESISFTIPFATVLNWTADGVVTIIADGDPTINTICSGNSFCVDARLEYPVTTADNDIGVLSIDSPTVFCPGTFDVYATIQNYGTNQVNSATIDWSVDGILQSSVNFSGLLDTANGSGSTMAQVLLGTFAFSTSNSYDVVAWTSMPNGNMDTVNVNDTTSSIKQSSLPPPSGITTSQLSGNQATLTWIGGSANSWLWVNVPAGNPLVGQGTPVSSATAVVTGLTSETDYDFYVREVCPTGDTSSWAGPFSYKTPFLCPPNSVCFLTGGQEGRTGPSQAQLNTIYAGTPLAGNVTSNNGIQVWNVPSSGLYKIIAYGAQGGGSVVRPGGNGAMVEGEFLLTGGTTLNIAVGQTGLISAATTPSGNRGGGGGSFVWDNANPTQPLIAAGGGGGSNVSITTAGLGVDGTGLPDGTQTAANVGVPGTNGNGANPGGAGFLTDGTNNATSAGTIAPQAAVNGAEGGDGFTATSHYGGFGGGGGGGGAPSTTLASGGGGGYSGGAGQTVPASAGGGGGGSFVGGTNAVSMAGVRSGPGLVIVEILSSGALNDIGVVSIDSPGIFCPGTFDVYTTINNFGSNQVTSATVGWSVDGVTQSPFSFSGLLDTAGGTGSTSAQINLGSFNFNSSAVFNVEVWTSNPNGATDTVSQNDTVATVVQSSLPAPINLQTTSVLGSQATFTWSGGSANSWLYSVVLTGQQPVNPGTSVSSPTVTVLGLSGETTYDFYVREVCPTGDTSLWAGPLTFTTPFFCPPNSFCFTTGGQTGNLGPDQTVVNAAYSGSNLDGDVFSDNGIQVWVVQSSGLYHIEAQGARGGNEAFNNNVGGKGAKVEGDFVLTQGDTVRLIVGQQGEDGCGAGGGGGATFIEVNGSLILVAGAGGGASSDNNGADASATNSGTNDFPGGSSPGGMNGNGGSTCTTGVNQGGGGGGYLTDGLTASSTDPGQGGFSFLNGGNGGLTDFAGGFGGGGACTNCTVGGGGGGGYSGGAGGQQVNACTSGINRSGGGGGGSYNIGLNAIATGGVRDGDGTVIMTVLSSGAANDLGVVSVDSPTVFCPGPQNVYASINNFGINQVTSAAVNWEVDGAAQTPASFSGTLDTAGGSIPTSAQVLLGSFNFATNNQYTIKVWTSNPNGNVDTVGQNDTLTDFVQSSLPPPTGLGIDAVSAGQVEFSWNPGSLANSWLWVVVPPGNLPSGVGTATSVPFDTVFGLTVNQNFDLYVREVCPTGDTSLWAGPLTFSTCIVLPPPFAADMNGNPPSLPPCWTTNDTSSLYTSSACAGSNAEHLVIEGVSGAFAETPQLDASSITSMRIQYRYRAGDPNCGETPDATDQIEVQYYDGTQWLNIVTYNGGSAGSPQVWTDEQFTITSGLSSDFKLRIINIAGSGANFDTWHFDDFSIVESPNRDLKVEQVTGLNTGCGLTANESFNVDITNDGALDQDTFDIEYSVNGGPFIVGATITSNLATGQTQTYSITGVDLSASGQNCVDVRVVLAGDQDPSNDALPQICITNQTVPTIDSVINGEVCNGGPVTLQVNFTGDNLNWFDDAGLTNQVNSGSTYTANFTQTTVLYLQAINSNGCTAPIQTITAEVNFTPTSNFTQIINNCTVDFTSLVSSNTDSVRWNFGDGVGTSTQLNPTYTYSTAQSFLVRLTAYDGTCFKDTTKAIFVNCQVGLKTNPWAENIKMFPNPSKGQVSLEVPFAEKQVLISVIDIKGQEVFRQEYSSDITFKKVIDLSYLDAGSYFVNIYSGDRSAVKKLTIE